MCDRRVTTLHIGQQGMSGERPLSHATFLPPPSATKLPAARPVRGGWRRDSSASVFCAPLLLPCKTGIYLYMSIHTYIQSNRYTGMHTYMQRRLTLPMYLHI